MGTSINSRVKVNSGRTAFIDRNAFRNSSIYPAEAQTGPWHVANPITFDTTSIGGSAWFDRSSSQRLTRTSNAASNTTECWISLWVLRTEFDAGTTWGILSLNNTQLFVNIPNGGDFLQIYGGPASTITTNHQFRDIGWCHILYHFKGTDSELFINGEEVTSFSIDDRVSFPSSIPLGSSTWTIGSQGGSNHFSGYIAQPAFIEDTGLTELDFGEFVNVGTNGFTWAPASNDQIIALADAAGGNSFCLTDGIGDGTDASSNGNDFTPSNMTHATNGSNNTPSLVYPVINTLHKTVRATLSNGNLSGSISNSGGTEAVWTTMGISTGKYTWEAQLTNGSNVAFGIANSYGGDTRLDGAIASQHAIVYTNSGTKSIDGGSNSAYGDSYTSSNRIRVELDADADEIEFFKDNVSQGTIAINSNETWFPIAVRYLSPTFDFIFDLVDFQDTPTAGFLPINSANLPTPTFQGVDFFETVLYTGNGTAIGSGGNAVTGAGFQPDFTWIKNTSAADQHILTDVVRGTTKYLSSDGLDAEVTAAEALASFNADGFTVGNDVQVNTNSENYVSWNYLAGGASVTNTTGSITSNVSVATPGHFSIMTYTGDGSVATIGHGLPGAPDAIIAKSRGTSNAWYFWTNNIGMDLSTNNSYLLLNLTNGLFTDGNNVHANTPPTSSSMTVSSNINVNAGNYISYAFRSVPGVCDVGSFEGNSSANGPYIRTGFKPRWLLIKDTAASDWWIFDTQRNTINPSTNPLWANLSNSASPDNAYSVDLLSDGFKIRNASVINSASTHIYMAIADVAGGGNLPPIPGA